jgi:membrane protease YdiL (CAAX protease family)
VGFGVAIVGYLGGGAAGPVLLVIGIAILALGLLAAAGAQALERKARGTEPYTGPSPLLVFAASIPIAYLLAIVAGFLLDAMAASATRPVAELLLLSLQAAAYFIVIGLTVVGTGALTWQEMGFHRDTRRGLSDLAYGAVFAGPVIGLTVIVSAILVALFRVAPENPLPPTGQPSGLLLHLIAGAVIAPIAEETLFRGVATTAWVRSLGERAGIIRGALFFAFAHVLLIGGSTVAEGLALAIVAFAGRLPVAFVLGWVFVRRQSIYASIGLHATFNAFLLVVAESAIRNVA